jgi:hypothetical protein
MNKPLIFLCICSGILVLSIIVICISPIINNFEVKEKVTWSFSSWRSLNCKIFADQEESETVTLDNIKKIKIFKNMCRRQRGMHDLEYTTLIIDLIIGIVCTNLSLFIYFKVGKDLDKKAGLISIIIGIIGFIMTFIYIGFSGYIFNNDPAFVNGCFDDSGNLQINSGIERLYSNGAYKKVDKTDPLNPKFINIFENDKDYLSKYVKFKDLGKNQYNYDKKFYNSFNNHAAGCDSDSSSCEYIYDEVNSLFTSYELRELHDQWLTTLIFSVFILACNAALVIFGFLIFKNGADSNEDKTLVIQ